jgi:hypothetical protein
MEGREAKHIAIATYARNTTYQATSSGGGKYFIVNIFLSFGCEGKVTLTNSISHSKLSYVSKRVKKDEYCNCGLDKLETDAECRFCSDTLRDKIKVSVDSGKVVF